MPLRRCLLVLLTAISLIACAGTSHHTNDDRPSMRLRYGPDNGQLNWKMVTFPRQGEALQRPADLRFRVLPPPRVEGDDLLLAGELENPGNDAVIVELFGVNWEPLTLSVRWENGLEWQPPCPDPWCAPQPPAPPPPFRITLPPHSVVEFNGRCDLRTIAYQGSPEATFDWRFSFHGTREAESGTLRFRLPPR